LGAWNSGWRGSFLGKPSHQRENSGKGKDFFSRGNGFSGKAKEKIGRGKEKISRAEDFSGLFFLPPCLGKHFSGKAKEKITSEAV